MVVFIADDLVFGARPPIWYFAAFLFSLCNSGGSIPLVFFLLFLEKPCASQEGGSMLLRREGGFLRREGGFLRKQSIPRERERYFHQERRFHEVCVHCCTQHWVKAKATRAEHVLDQPRGDKSNWSRAHN